MPPGRHRPFPTTRPSSVDVMIQCLIVASFAVTSLPFVWRYTKMMVVDIVWTVDPHLRWWLMEAASSFFRERTELFSFTEIFLRLRYVGRLVWVWIVGASSFTYLQDLSSHTSTIQVVNVLPKRGKDGFGLDCLRRWIFGVQDGGSFWWDQKQSCRTMVFDRSVRRTDSGKIDCRCRRIRITMIRGENKIQELKNRN